MIKWEWNFTRQSFQIENQKKIQSQETGLGIQMRNAALLEIPIAASTIKGKRPSPQPAVIADKAASFHLNQNLTSLFTAASVLKRTNQENQENPSFQDAQKSVLIMLKINLAQNPKN